MIPDDVISELFAKFYDRLNTLAKSFMRRERKDHDWESHDLVHECYLRLRRSGIDWPNADLIRVAAGAMRYALVDHARSKYSAKRGYSETSARQHVPPIEPFYEENFDLKITIDEALAELRAKSPEEADAIELRAAGFTGVEIAEILGYPYPEWPRYWRKGWSPAIRSFTAALQPYTGLSEPRYWPYYPWSWAEWERRRPKASPWIIAATHLRRQLGNATDWTSMMLEIQRRIDRRSDRAFYLYELDEVAEAVRCDLDQALIALTALTHAPLNLLTMELRNGSVQGPRVRTEEMVSRLRGWHRTKTVSDEAWEDWTSNVWVIWTDQEFRGDAR